MQLMAPYLKNRDEFFSLAKRILLAGLLVIMSPAFSGLMDDLAAQDFVEKSNSRLTSTEREKALSQANELIDFYDKEESHQLRLKTFYDIRAKYREIIRVASRKGEVLPSMDIFLSASSLIILENAKAAGLKTQLTAKEMQANILNFERRFNGGAGSRDDLGELIIFERETEMKQMEKEMPRSSGSQIPFQSIFEAAGSEATQEAGNNAAQQAGNDAVQDAGNDAAQGAGNEAAQNAGNDAAQEAGADGTQDLVGNVTQDVAQDLDIEMDTDVEMDFPAF